MNCENPNQHASRESEQSVIGGLLLDNNAIDRCAGLKPEMFFYPAHRLIFTAIKELIAANNGADVITVSEFLKARDQADLVGGLPYLAEIAKNTPSAANIRRYVGVVKERHGERLLRRASSEILDLSDERAGRSIAERQAEAVKILTDLAQSAADAPRETTAADAVREWQQEMDERAAMPPGALLGLPTGLKKLDEATGGLRRGDLIVIGGRPSMGKSVLAEMIARTNAKDKRAVRTHSLEMPAKDIIGRSCAAEMGADYGNIRHNRMTASDLHKYQEFRQKIAYWNWLFDCDSADADKVAARCRAQQRKSGLDLLVVDHLHLMSYDKAREVSALGEITGKLKRLAVELNIVVVLVAQLNRSSAREHLPPSLTDLRSSGAIEQDADVVIFPHRPAYYNDKKNPYEAQLIIAKYRNGMTETLHVGWQGKHQRFAGTPDIWTPPAPHYTDGRENEDCL